MRLKGYREWTESLGSDREWKIQSVQHAMASRISELAASIGSFAIPHRYDSFVLLTDGVKGDDVDGVIRGFSSFSPVGVEVCHGFGEDYLQALGNCYDDRYGGAPDSEVAVAHFDLDGFTDLKDGAEAYVRAVKLVAEAQGFFLPRGALIHYLGGDNVVAFLPPGELGLIEDFLRGKPGIKVGVGRGRTAREALSLAAEGLDGIRRSRPRERKMQP